MGYSRYGLLKEAIALLVIVASQIDAKTLNSFFEMLEGVDSLVKLSFPEGQYRFRLKAGVFTQEEIFNRTVDCLPMYQMQMVSLHSENWTDSSGLGNA